MTNKTASQEDRDKHLSLSEKWDLDSEMLDNDDSGIRIAPNGLTKEEKDNFWVEIRELDKEEDLLDSSLTEEQMDNVEYIQNVYLKSKEAFSQKEKQIIEKYQKIAEENKKKGLT